MKHLFAALLLIVIFMPQRALAVPIENFGKPIEAYAIRPGLLVELYGSGRKITA